MKLVPLGDRVVLKQNVAEETTKSGIVLTGYSKREAPAGRSNRCRTWRSSRWQGSYHACNTW